MIEVGQLRRWTFAGSDHGRLFLVLEHSPFEIGLDLMDDGWTIMESGGEPHWEIAEHITDLSEEVTQ